MLVRQGYANWQIWVVTWACTWILKCAKGGTFDLMVCGHCLEVTNLFWKKDIRVFSLPQDPQLLMSIMLPPPASGLQLFHSDASFFFSRVTLNSTHCCNSITQVHNHLFPLTQLESHSPVFPHLSSVVLPATHCFLGNGVGICP